MSILLWIVFGALVGWVASIVMGTDDSQGLFMDIVMGILGAVVGGFIVSMFGGPGVTGLNLYSLVVALFGAMALIWVGKRFV